MGGCFYELLRLGRTFPPEHASFLHWRSPALVLFFSLHPPMPLFCTFLHFPLPAGTSGVFMCCFGGLRELRVFLCTVLAACGNYRRRKSKPGPVTLEAGHGNFELLLVFWLSVPGVPLAGSRLAPSGSPLGPGGGRGWVGGDLPGAIPASCPLLAAPS